MARRKQLSEAVRGTSPWLPRPMESWEPCFQPRVWAPQARANSNWLEQWVLNEIASSCWSISFNSSNIDRRFVGIVEGVAFQGMGACSRNLSPVDTIFVFCKAQRQIARALFLRQQVDENQEAQGWTCFFGF